MKFFFKANDVKFSWNLETTVDLFCVHFRKTHKGISFSLVVHRSPRHRVILPYNQSVSSAAQSCSTLCDPVDCSPWGLLVHHQLPEFTQTHIHRVGDAIQPSSSVVPFSFCPQSLPASEFSPRSQLFTWAGQSIGLSALASVLPKNTQDWSLEWTGWISLQSKGLSRVFSNTTVQKHQFFGVQPSSRSNSHIHTWPQEKP